jgi:hypothetical protein
VEATRRCEKEKRKGEEIGFGFLFFEAFVRIYFFDRADIESVMGAKEQGRMAFL